MQIRDVKCYASGCLQIHNDLRDDYHVPTLGRHNSFVSFIDDYSSYAHIFFVDE